MTLPFDPDGQSVSPEARSDRDFKQTIGDASFQELYTQLHKIASARMSGEAAGNTLRPTALVSELYLKVRAQSASNVSKEDFLAVAARMMRQILVDRARRKSAVKRGSAAKPIHLDTADALSSEAADYLIEVDEALDALAKDHARAANVVHLKFFFGMTFEEIAHQLNIAAATAKADWALARAYLRRHLSTNVVG